VNINAQKKDAYTLKTSLKAVTVDSVPRAGKKLLINGSINNGKFYQNANGNILPLLSQSNTGFIFTNTAAY
jgi:hypothetical protein